MKGLSGRIPEENPGTSALVTAPPKYQSRKKVWSAAQSPPWPVSLLLRATHSPTDHPSCRAPGSSLPRLLCSLALPCKHGLEGGLVLAWLRRVRPASALTSHLEAAGSF